MKHVIKGCRTIEKRNLIDEKNLQHFSIKSKKTQKNKNKLKNYKSWKTSN